MPQSLIDRARNIETVLRIDDEEELNRVLSDEHGDDLGRIAAFRRLVEIEKMDARRAKAFHPRSERLRRLVIQYLASVAKTPAKPGKRGRKAAIPSLGGMDTVVIDWREEALEDPSPSVQRLARMRD